MFVISELISGRKILFWGVVPVSIFQTSPLLLQFRCLQPMLSQILCSSLQDTCLVDREKAFSSLYASRWLGAGGVNCFHGFLIRNKMFPALVNTNRTSAIRQTMANASFFHLAGYSVVQRYYDCDLRNIPP